MRNLKKMGLIAFGMLALATTANAQDEVEGTIAADFVSQYIWRGQDCGNVSIQPTLGIAYKGLSLTGWGSVGFDKDDTKEFDLTAAYSVGGFNIGVTDYWFNTVPKYFKYAAHETSHVYEANIGYDFGPVAFQWYTNFAGNDYGDNDKRDYSSYMELSAPFKLASLDWTATVGAVPYNSALYGVDGFAVTNVSLKASKDINITNSFTVPVFAAINTNPAAQKAYFVVGFTLQP